MLYYILYLFYIYAYSIPIKNNLTKCVVVKDFPIQSSVHMGLSGPSAGAANFHNTQHRAWKCSLLSSAGGGSREGGTFEVVC